MKDFFARLSARFSNFMQDRYGADNLTNALVWLAIIVMFIELFAGTGILSLLMFIVLIWAIFRCLSKNIEGRRRENEAFLRIIQKPKRAFALWKKMWVNRKTTVYFKCKGCGQVLSVPKGKGTLRVVCPKCKTETTRKS